MYSSQIICVLISSILASAQNTLEAGKVGIMAPILRMSVVCHGTHSQNDDCKALFPRTEFLSGRRQRPRHAHKEVQRSSPMQGEGRGWLLAPPETSRFSSEVTRSSRACNTANSPLDIYPEINTHLHRAEVAVTDGNLFLHLQLKSANSLAPTFGFSVPVIWKRPLSVPALFQGSL